MSQIAKYGVYMPHQERSEDPKYYVTLDEARTMQRNKTAYFINHGKAIRLTGEAVAEAKKAQKERWIVKLSGCEDLDIAPVSVWQLA